MLLTQSCRVLFSCFPQPFNSHQPDIVPGSSWPTIPQVYLKGEFIGGCDIMLQMHQSGELEKMLTEAKLVDATTAAAE